MADLIDRGWGTLSRWVVPVMMTVAYALLAATADTSLGVKAWMAGGLGLVLIAWLVFRALIEAAALSRALDVGDTARLFELADRHLAHRRRPADRARFQVGRGLAHLVRGEHAEALAALDDARPGPELQPLAGALAIAARIELGRPDGDGDRDGLAVRAPRAPWLAWLADGLIAWRAGELDAAAPLLARVIDDIRAGSALRAIAQVYAARIAQARGDPATAARHRAAAAALAAPDAAWLRGEPASTSGA
jgi:hypothetical protein